MAGSLFHNADLRFIVSVKRNNTDRRVKRYLRTRKRNFQHFLGLPGKLKATYLIRLANCCCFKLRMSETFILLLLL